MRRDIENSREQHRGAWGPSIRKWFTELWQEQIKDAKAAHEPVWPVIQKKLQWRTRISCILQRSNAQMLLSRVPSTRSPPALPMRIAPGHPASRTPTPTAVTV